MKLRSQGNIMRIYLQHRAPRAGRRRDPPARDPQQLGQPWQLDSRRGAAARAHGAQAQGNVAGLIRNERERQNVFWPAESDGRGAEHPKIDGALARRRAPARSSRARWRRHATLVSDLPCI